LHDVVDTRLVTWQHSQAGRFHGISIYYKPVTTRDLDRSYIQATTEADTLADAEAYARLALNEQTGWHRIALNPLALSLLGGFLSTLTLAAETVRLVVIC